MAGEDQRRLAVIPEVIEQLFCSRSEFDATLLLGMIGVVVPDVIEVGELGADATEIVPNAGQNGFDLFR